MADRRGYHLSLLIAWVPGAPFDGRRFLGYRDGHGHKSPGRPQAFAPLVKLFFNNGHPMFCMSSMATRTPFGIVGMRMLENRYERVQTASRT